MLSVTPVESDSEEDPPASLTLVDSDSEDEEARLLDTALSGMPTVACPRANIHAEYGQELYLIDVSRDEAPSRRKVAAILKHKCKVTSPRFAEWANIIQCNVEEELLCSTEKDETSDYFDDPSQDQSVYSVV